MKQNLRCRSIPMIAGVVAMLAIAACSGGPKGTSPTVPANIEELKSAVSAILKKYNVPGVGIALVTKDAVVWTGGVGKADLATNRDVTGGHDVPRRLDHQGLRRFVGVAARRARQTQPRREASRTSRRRYRSSIRGMQRIP